MQEESFFVTRGLIGDKKDFRSFIFVLFFFLFTLELELSSSKSSERDITATPQVFQRDVQGKGMINE